MAEMQPWTANERTKIPAYDKAFNGLVAPMLEVYTQELLNDPRFKQATLTQQRRMLKKSLSDVKKIVRDRNGERLYWWFRTLCYVELKQHKVQQRNTESYNS